LKVLELKIPKLDRSILVVLADNTYLQLEGHYWVIFMYESEMKGSPKDGSRKIWP
tara:strand:+ start:630 stop:794 length:165 start_codon:yes stop_codon:yes gene_type:complete